MTREEHLKFCKSCRNQEFDRNQGIICSITNKIADFEDDCPNYITTETVSENISSEEKIVKPNEQRARTVLLLIWIMFFLEIASLFSSFLQYNLLQIASSGRDITNEAANANDIREMIIAILYIIAYIISGIAFILWFRRAYFNLHQKVNNLSQPENMAAISWFIPIVNLYRPLQIMKELYVETNKFVQTSGKTIRAEFSTNFLSLWWTFWIINGIVGQLIYRFSKNADTIEKLINSTIADIISNIFGIALAIITIKVIKDYAKVEYLIQD